MCKKKHFRAIFVFFDKIIKKKDQNVYLIYVYIKPRKNRTITISVIFRLIFLFFLAAYHISTKNETKLLCHF